MSCTGTSTKAEETSAEAGLLLVVCPPFAKWKHMRGSTVIGELMLFSQDVVSFVFSIAFLAHNMPCMPAKITTVEFRFDEEGLSKDGMFFRGPFELLALPREGEAFDLDKPLGIRGRVIRREVLTTGVFTQVILHCRRRRGFVDLFRWK